MDCIYYFCIIDNRIILVMSPTLLDDSY